MTLHIKFKTFPFPIKSLALSAHVSPRTIHFQVLDKSPLPATDTLEKGMATYSSILAWRIPGERSLTGCSPWGYKESNMTEQLTLSFLQRHKGLGSGHGRGHQFSSVQSLSHVQLFATP